MFLCNTSRISFSKKVSSLRYKMLMFYFKNSYYHLTITWYTLWAPIWHISTANSVFITYKNVQQHLLHHIHWFERIIINICSLYFVFIISFGFPCLYFEILFVLLFVSLCLILKPIKIIICNRIGVICLLCSTDNIATMIIDDSIHI